MTDFNNTNENDALNFANEDQTLPSGLNVLSILTFIGSGIALVFSFAMPWYVKFLQGIMDKAAASGQEFTQKQLDDMAKGKKALELLSANLVPVIM